MSIIFDSLLDEQINAKVIDDFERFKEERSNKDITNDISIEEDPSLVYLKFFRKLIFTRYNEDSFLFKLTDESTSFIFTIIYNDSVMRLVYFVLRNTNNIAHKSYLVNYVYHLCLKNGYSDLSQDNIYKTLNNMIILGIIENVDKGVRFTSSFMNSIFVDNKKKKNYRHKEVPHDLKSHTKLYINLISVGYIASVSNTIYEEESYNFSKKRAILIDKETILYRNRNYFDSDFFLTHTNFKTVYVLSDKLASKNDRLFDVKLLEDCIDYEKY